MKNGRPTQLGCFVSGLSPNSAKKANGIKLRVTKEKLHGTLAATFSSDGSSIQIVLLIIVMNLIHLSRKVVFTFTVIVCALVITKQENWKI